MVESAIPGAEAYRAAGVDVDRKAAVNARLAEETARRPDSRVLAGIGAFSGLVTLPPLREPVLAATVDSVGTKLKVAIALGRHEVTARDIVNHGVNDVLCSGLEPLAFLDYLGMHQLDADVVAAVVAGARAACDAAGCILLGGETAELPDVYAPGDYDLAGSMLGVGERSQVIDGHEIRAGDVVIGLPSAGLHTNGYALARRLIPPEEWQTYSPLLGCTYGEALLAEHRSYLQPVRRLRAQVGVLGLAHITGGGLFDNLPRCLPDGLGMRLDGYAWSLPPIMLELRRRGQLSDAEVARTFNAGIGMAAVVRAEDAARALSLLSDACRIGEVIPIADGPRVLLDGPLR
jgi:phosphoribosylformylglycinamidine cyclo-ligase